MASWHCSCGAPGGIGCPSYCREARLRAEIARLRSEMRERERAAILRGMDKSVRQIHRRYNLEKGSHGDEHGYSLMPGFAWAKADIEMLRERYERLTAYWRDRARPDGLRDEEEEDE